MEAEVTALAYHVRFVPPSLMDVMDRFYGDLVGMPRYARFRLADGNAENKDFYWAGEAVVLNHNCGAPNAPSMSQKPIRHKRGRCRSTA